MESYSPYGWSQEQSHLVSLLAWEAVCDCGLGELQLVTEQGDNGWISEEPLPEEVSGKAGRATQALS